MNSDIEIRYRHIPSEIIDDFKINLEKTGLSLEIIHDKKEYFRFTGGPADILIYVNEHLTDIIVGGVLYDFLKQSFISTWKKLILYYKTKELDLQKDKNYIEVNFILSEEKTIQFALKGHTDLKTVNNTVGKIFDYLKDKSKQGKDLQNSELFTPQSLKPRIRLKFNSQADCWEPVNFAELKKELEEFNRRAQQNTSN